MTFVTAFRAALLAAVACSTGAASSPATAAAEAPRTCTSPPLSSRVLETPSLMLTYAELRKERSLQEAKTRVCWRGQRKFEDLGASYDVNGVSGGVTFLGATGGRFLFMELWESTSTDEGSSDSAVRYVLDAKTHRATRAGDDDAVAGPAGMLTRGGGGLVLRAPGRTDRSVAKTGYATSLALGRRTAYWKDAKGAPHSAPVPVQLRAAPQPRGRTSPRDAHGPCEPRGSRTLMRLPGGRFFVTRSGARKMCAGKTKRVAALPAGELTPLSERFVAVRSKTAIAVVDVKTATIRHRAEDITGAAPTPYGIVVTDASGVRWVHRDESKQLSTEPGSDPGFASASYTDDEEELAENGEDFYRARAYWTTPAGVQSALPF